MDVVPLAVVQLVVSFYASTGEEVVGEVVLNASASSQESRLVTTGVAVSSYVGQAAVLNATFNVWTQSVASVVEVVLSVQTEVSPLIFWLPVPSFERVWSSAS
jgi:hypothetical protein